MKELLLHDGVPAFFLAGRNEKEACVLICQRYQSWWWRVVWVAAPRFNQQLHSPQTLQGLCIRQAVQQVVLLALQGEMGRC